MGRPTTYSLDGLVFDYQPDPDPQPGLLEQLFGGGLPLVYVYRGERCIGTLDEPDENGTRWVRPLTVTWQSLGGDQA